MGSEDSEGHKEEFNIIKSNLFLLYYIHVLLNLAHPPPLIRCVKLRKFVLFINFLNLPVPESCVQTY